MAPTGNVFCTFKLALINETPKRKQHFIVIEQLSWIRYAIFPVCFIMIFKTSF